MRLHDDVPPPSPPDLRLIRLTLAATPCLDHVPAGRHAAVALVLAGPEADLHACLILRAEHEPDRWSGHMALPGGRVEQTDASPRAAAMRETLEEVGLRLDAAAHLGSLEPVPVSSAGKPTGMSLSCFVFHLGETLPPLTPNHEVAEAYWIPLRHLLDPGNAAHRPTVRDGIALRHPAVLYRGQHIWGLTYRLLTMFFARMQLQIAAPR